MELRPYQIKAVEQIREAIVQHGSCVFVLATGAGKTAVAGRIAELAFAKGKRTMFLVHRRELVAQTYDTLCESIPSSQIGVTAAGWPETPWAMLQIASVQSLARRKHVRKPDLLIVDEAHHCRAKTWATIIEKWRDIPRIGLTATPERLDGKGLGEHFATMVLGPDIPTLIDDGYLAPVITRRIPSGLALGDVRKDRHGEYMQSDLRDRVNPLVVASAVDAYMDYALGKRAIMFGVHTAHSRQVCEGLRARGVRAAHVDGTDSPSRRDRIMAEFRTGGLDLVGNCDLISEGFDAPACEVVIMGAPTSSITRYLQQAGRAMRPGPGKVAEVLDLAGSSHELGLPDDPREWSLDDGEVNQREKSMPSPRECPACKALFHGSKCRACGHEWTAAELPPVEEVRVELETATPGPRRGPKLRRPELNRKLREARLSGDPRAALEAIAEQNGYHKRWVGHIYRAWNLVK